MALTVTAAGVVLIFTLLRLLGNEREHAQRRQEAMAQAVALVKEAQAANALVAQEAPAPKPSLSKPAAPPTAAKPPAKKAA